MSRAHFIEEAYLKFQFPKTLAHLLNQPETTCFNTKRSQAVLRTIGAGLADQSYVIGEVGPGKGAGAGVACSFGGYAKATLLLDVDSENTCYLTLWIWRPSGAKSLVNRILGRRHLDQASERKEVERFKRSIIQVMCATLNVSPASWLTYEEVREKQLL